MEHRIKNGILITFLLAASILMIVLGFASLRGKTSDEQIRIYINGELYKEENLVPGKRIRIQQENGCVNVIRMTDHGFLMESSTCHNQLCIQQGEVTNDNYALRALGNQVICIPNRVTVELVLNNAESVNPDSPDV